ncbi:unnamed protein product (macronuclear) [Paramecium tetraurelia]|uniref:Uncharacterized protein n=1 Tax=Paramecium tetraurelia TaxID=5888 RepID=A0BNK1_PARTE|nr:uncharacterized protein GSPATT00030756001 [Paramecium tetraurelia]CAK60118.1 unnamed protein product [Paramecium tetraurelia]|eukprot:XP_001427516.1 hypothetical protein (macronuclear) [Paramecium tetraurelia strain d4-2]
MGKFRKYNNKENIIMEEKLEDGNLQLLRPNEQDIIIQVFFAQNLLVPVDRIMIINFKHKKWFILFERFANYESILADHGEYKHGKKQEFWKQKKNKIFGIIKLILKGNYRAGIKLKSGILKSIQRGRLDSRRSRIQSIWIKGDQWGAQFR